MDERALGSVADLKAELQSRGVRLSGGDAHGPAVRIGGAGPAEGITLLLGGSPASVPFSSGFVSDSPFSLETSGDEWALCREGGRLGVKVSVLPAPAFYTVRSAEGIPYRKIALLHGLDCLASTVLQSCVHWGTPAGCRFCGIGLSWKSGRTVLKKRPDALAEVAVAASEFGARHVTLTAGSTRDGRLEEKMLGDSARAIVAASGLPVHVQLMPTVSRHSMERLQSAGVASIGIHRESFDADVLKKIAPCKASIPEDEFFRAWQDAVSVFGRGQVSSFLLMGLGETIQGLLEGCRRLSALGVYPYLVPFRPIPGTPMASWRPPDPAFVKEVCRQAAAVLEESGLDWRDVKAGCVRCRGCSALPDYQDARARNARRFVSLEEPAWEVVAGGPFLEAAYAMRHEIFVQEQGLFDRTDRDRWDPDSVHIVARQGSWCLGTVRITPLGDGAWLGSRLAVREGRGARMGWRLVKKAEEEVLSRGGRTFVAYIQLSKVGFFERCGWRRLEWVPDYHGRPHMLMAADGPRWMSFARKPLTLESLAR